MRSFTAAAEADLLRKRGAEQRLYARRGYGYEAHTGAFTKPVTFVSWDEADRQSAGFDDRWHDDLSVIDWNGRKTLLVHVMSASWRCREPLSVGRKAAA